MFIQVTTDDVIFDKDSVRIHEGEYKINRCYFEFSEEYEDVVKIAVFTIVSTGEFYNQDIIDNECDIPAEVLKEELEEITLGVYGYVADENEKLERRYSPTATKFYVQKGSYKEGGKTPEMITPSQYEMYSQKLQEGLDEVANVNISATQGEGMATITITDRNGDDHSVEVHDGEKGETGDTGPAGNGITGVEKTGTSGLVDTYTMHFTDTPDFDYEITNGEDGEDGYTPQKGVDYFTPEDIASLNIPRNTSDLNNNSGFITNTVNNLTNYTLKINTGSLIDLEINSSTYVVSLSLKDQDGNVISTDSIDLPLETVVVDGRYDSTTKEVILTLENGNEVRFSVADLVAGLQTELNSSNKLNADYIDDSNSGKKLVTTSEKTTWNNKLDSSDLTDYVKNTDYATSSKAGVIKASSYYGFGVGSGDGVPSCIVKNYNDYPSASTNMFIAKGTLENVITGKDLTTKAYVDSLVGDINTALDTINGEVI